MAFPLPNWSGAIEPHWGKSVGGSDLFAAKGSPVVAPVSGVVVDAGNSDIGGNNLTLKAANGLLFYMAHLDSLLVSTGQKVTEGDKLGTVGNTGNASTTPPHLHIGIGRSIVSGGGATGGTGLNFDAVSWLKNALTNKSPGNSGAPGMPEPGAPEGPAGPSPIPTTPFALPEIPSVPTTSIIDAIAGLPKAIITPIQEQIGQAFSFLQWLGQRNLSLRIGLIILGALMLVLGLVLFALSFVSPETAKQVAAVV